MSSTPGGPDSEKDRATKVAGERADPGDATADGQGAPFATTHVIATNAPTHSGPTIIPSWGPSAYASLPEPGYQIGALIGRGGMGEVVVAQDQRIGREVAVKRIRAKHPSHDAVERFLREARIQARLDHPAIVPVYELGTDADGLPYFTMKRLSGVTLSKRLAEKSSIQPLLRAFVDVCLAIQLAHTRGVVHRDLKPSNIMLGDYGEVYVLDWGVARVTSDRSRTTHGMQAVSESIAEDEDGTTAGAILGTPGYMPPEQIKGHEITTAADVYSLGAILFEILAGEPLHPRGEAAMATTLTSPQEAPAKRAGESVPPELDGVCFDALAENPEERPSARELADRIQSYLDGDRDLERRRTLANIQLQSAQDALANGGLDAHASAMRRAGRALALDPDNEDAAALVGKLLLEPPKNPPKELQDAVEKDRRSGNAQRQRTALLSYIGVLAISVALLPFLHVRDWTLQLSYLGINALLCGLAYRGMVTKESRLRPMLVVNLLGIIVFSRILGPFMLTPIATIAIIASFASSPRLLAKPSIIWIWVLIAVAVPVGAEVSGLFPPTFSVGSNSILTGSQFYFLDNAKVSEIVLIIGNFFFICVAVRMMISINKGRHEAHQKLLQQAWHLEQMLPAKRPWQTKPSASAIAPSREHKQVKS